jgi:predicted solute-binding protein
MIRLAFPKNEIYQPLFQSCEDYCKAHNIRYYKLSESECAEFLLNNLVDAAFVSPLGYGKGVKVADFRIIPGPMLFTEDYTGIATIYFNKGLTDVTSIHSNSPDDFIMIIAKLILSEKFGINLNIEKNSGTISEILAKNDSAILWGKENGKEVTLDVSEEWYDLVEEPLPLGFWVCRAEGYPPNIKQIISEIASSSLPDKQEIEENLEDESKYYRRKGLLYWKWNPDLETSIETVLLFLYMHQLISEIPAVKILERDL